MARLSHDTLHMNMMLPTALQNMIIEHQRAESMAALAEIVMSKIL
jgi:hypothetical protein